jgi:hypothetical protein
MNEKQWIGRTIYQVDNDFYELQNLKVEILNSEMHIFFLMIEKSIRNQALLMQCIWNENDTKMEKLQTVVLDSHLEENYLLEVEKKGSLELLFVTYERDEFELNLSSYKNHNWTPEKRLYCIKGEEIDFEIVPSQQVIHIINKYKENSMYYLDYVCIEKNGTITGSKVHESSVELENPILLLKEKTIYTFWIEENKIYYSFFDGECWNKPIYCKNNIDQKIDKFHFHSEYSKSVKEKEVYGTGEYDLRLFLPYQFVMNVSENQMTEDNIVQASALDRPQIKDNIKTHKLELIKMKSENRELNKRIASLNMQLQKLKRTIQEQEEHLTRAMQQKQNSEENCNLYLKLQKKVQDELEQTSQQFLLEHNLRAEIENKWKICEGEIVELRRLNEGLSRENEKVVLEKDQLLIGINAKMKKSFLERFRKGKSNDIKT